MSEETGETISETLQNAVADVIANLSSKEPSSNASEKVPTSTEGIALAYGSLVIMAILPIIFGSIRSVKLQKSKKVGSPSEFYYTDLYYNVIVHFYRRAVRRLIR